jgi:catechol 2,3-dioxygenase-like lactoylglutathione lyase family enzyme
MEGARGHGRPTSDRSSTTPSTTWDWASRTALASAAAQIRIARSTGRLEELIDFYRDRLGLEVIDSFRDHDGYTGVMVGLPGESLHLEFTTNEREAATEVGLAPTQENLLVFYIADEQQFELITQRIQGSGVQHVPPANPYWSAVGAQTFEDPDGWRIVVVPGPYET